MNRLAATMAANIGTLPKVILQACFKAEKHEVASGSLTAASQE
jgi:hypothetical protein